MSLLAELFAEEKISPLEKPAEEKISPPQTVAAETPRDAESNHDHPGRIHIAPCPVCSSPLFWLSVYRDGIIRCRECQPPPSRKMVRAFLAIAPRTRDIPGGGEFQFEALTPELEPANRNTQPGGLGDSNDPEPTYRNYSPQHIAQHYPPWPNDWDRKRRDHNHILAEILTGDSPLDHCIRCSSQEYRDTEIHAGRSTRRECSRCGITWGFTQWAGSDVRAQDDPRIESRGGRGQAVSLPAVLEDLF